MTSMMRAVVIESPGNAGLGVIAEPARARQHLP